MMLDDVSGDPAKASLGGSRSPTNSRGADRVLSRRLNTPAQPSRQRTAGVSALTGDAPSRGARRGDGAQRDERHGGQCAGVPWDAGQAMNDMRVDWQRSSMAGSELGR